MQDKRCWFKGAYTTLADQV